ncbi:MAG: hypothetical protein ACRDJM_05670, partial [Actinomycetota bacterium]
PYGAALSWPESPGRPARSAGAYVVLHDGAPCCFVERGGRSLATFAAAGDDPSWIEGLVSLVKDGRVRSLELSRIDGAPAREAPFADALRAAGFADAYRGLTLRS